MKLFLLLVVSIAFIGCVKEQCWTCETSYRTTYSDGSPAEESSITESMCNYTETEIEEYERGSSLTTTYTAGSLVMVTTTTTRCSR